jgi:adenylate cyclase
MLHKILVVDSENLVCDSCCIALGNMGHEVFCADEEQAVEIAKNDNFDLVVVNGRSEKMTGGDIFGVLRRSIPGLSGILISDQENTDMVIEAMKIGFSRVCKAPLEVKQLVEAVKDTLEISNLREDITRMKILLPLYKLSQRFIAAESEQAIYEALADAVSQEVKVPSVSVMMFDDVANCLKVVASRGLVSSYVENLQIKSGEWIAGKVFQSQKPVILNKANQHQSPFVDLMKRTELSAAISFPIACKGRVLEMLSIIVDQAVMALENIRSIREREESSRIRALLEQYVSPEVSNLLVKSNQDPLDEGSVQELTVFFADIRNFTLLVQYLDPAELRIFLNSFFDMFADIVFSHQGMLDKFMGDAALVIFGAPVKIEKPNVAAVSAAHQIMAKFHKLRIFWEKKNNIFKKVGLGIGISRGPMFLGNVGSSKRLDYTVIGPDVNIAQRLASETESGQILITDRVHATLSGKFPVRSEKKMLLRGMESQVTVYSLSDTE